MPPGFDMHIAYMITRAFALPFAQEQIISHLSLPLSLSLFLGICFDRN